MRRRALFAVLAITALAALVASLERRISPGQASNIALTTSAFGLLVPFTAYGVLGTITSGGELVTSFGRLARFGANRRLLLVGFSTVALLASVGAALLVESVTLVFAHEFGSSKLYADWLITSRVAIVAGAAYCVYFAAASTFGKSGQGRLFALLLDWTLGSGAGTLAMPWPRGHIRNLLGAEPVLNLSQPAATLCLGAIMLVGATVLLARTPP